MGTGNTYYSYIRKNIRLVHCPFKQGEGGVEGGEQRKKEREMNQQGGCCVYFVLEGCVR